MFLLRQSTHRMLIQYDRDVGHIFSAQPARAFPARTAAIRW